DLDSGTSILGNHTIIVEVDPLNAIGEWNEDDNRRFFNVTVLEPKPDLEVTAVAVAGEPARGIPSTVMVTVFNGGAETVSGAYIELRVDGELVNSWNVTLAEGGLRELEYDYTWAEHNPTVMGYADPNKVIDELDESNNYKSIWVAIAAPRHDVQLGAISHSGEAFEGQWVELTVELQNLLGEVPHYRLSLFVVPPHPNTRTRTRCRNSITSKDLIWPTMNRVSSQSGGTTPSVSAGTTCPLRSRF
ncbi:MAG: hypothetical protein CXX75_03075, partial [Methanobacteriota archaeon]